MARKNGGGSTNGSMGTDVRFAEAFEEWVKGENAKTLAILEILGYVKSTCTEIYALAVSLRSDAKAGVPDLLKILHVAAENMDAAMELSAFAKDALGSFKVFEKQNGESLESLMRRASEPTTPASLDPSTQPAS